MEAYKQVGFRDEGRMRQAVYRDGRYLDVVMLGILREEKVGREKLFLHTKYMKLLTTDTNDVEPYADPTSKDAAHNTTK